MVGYVQTYKRYNPGLIPLTNRQGLIENDDFQKLRRFVFEYAIKPLERYYFVKFKKNVNETLEKVNDKSIQLLNRSMILQKRYLNMIKI